ncbi:MAG: orotidine-5'-phosphate decarboxylase [Kiloniellales bacterium]
MATAAERLIVALDVPSVGEAGGIVATLDGLVSFFKIGLHLQMARGTEGFIDALQRNRKRVFVDYKYGDIPETVRAGVAACAERRIDFLTLQGTGGITRDVLRAAMRGKRRGRPKVLLVTALTSLGDRDREELGTARTVEDIVRHRVEMALEAGLDGVIASGREAALIRVMAPSDQLTIVCPGIRPAGAGTDDHKRAATPREAILGGADYLVVGRPIVKAPDPRRAAQAIVDEIAGAIADS